MPNYKLVNARKRAAESPDTFHIPTQTNLNSLSPGDYVKLIFYPGERLWVQIQNISDNLYTGLLSNIPVLDIKAKYKDSISFKTRHITEIMKSDKCMSLI